MATFPKTVEQAERFLEECKTAERLFPCEHGHYECSTTRNGPCMDEVWHAFPELQTEL